MVTATIHPAAVEELAEAAAFYEDRSPGLGRELFDEAQRIILLLRENPEIGAQFQPPYRRLVCRRFPFSIVYRPIGSGIRILAIMHHHRQPGYWRRRS